MNLFGLHGMRPMSLARISGMRLLRVRRRDTSPVSTVSYLHLASALSATVVRNVTGAIGQAGGEMVHTSSSSSSLAGDDRASLIESHAQYSFIAVVALMSLFLVITISATGLLLAFCRKKNAVFTAPAKPEADSNLELDDIDGSDVDICRGDKGECYYHLSDDDDDSDEEDADNGDGDSEKEAERVKRLSKRSRTFPQLRRILERHRGNKARNGKETRISTVIEPLMNKDDSAKAINQSFDSKLANASNESHGPKMNFCRNPNHQHYSRQHHNCLYNRPHYHQKSQRHVSRHQTRGNSCCSKLQRSHTIHFIPQTAPKSRAQTTCDVKIRVQDMEVIMSSERRVEPAEVGTVQLHYIPTISSSVRYNANSIDHTDDLFNEAEASFSNLKLRMDEDICSDTHSTPTADVHNNCYGPDRPPEQTLWPTTVQYSSDQALSAVSDPPTGSRLLGDFLTCSTGSTSQNDCIFSRDKTSDVVSDGVSQNFRQEQVGHKPHTSFTGHNFDVQLPPNTCTPFHNLLFEQIQRSASELSLPSKPSHSSDMDHNSLQCTTPSTCLHPSLQPSSKKLIHHSGNEDKTPRRRNTFTTGTINHPDTRPNQSANNSDVDQALPGHHGNSNPSLGERSTSVHSDRVEYALTLKNDTEYLGQNRDFLSCLGNASQSRSLKETLENNNEDNEDEYDDNQKLVGLKACNDISSDEDEDDFTLSLLI